MHTTIDLQALAARSTTTLEGLEPSRWRSTLRAEWTKARTVRSTWTTLLVSASMAVLLAAIVAATEVSEWDERSATQRAEFDATKVTLIGVLFSAVIIGSLGIRAMTSEHSTGMIRATFAAMPRRRDVVLAKATVLAAVALPVALVSNVMGFAVGQELLASKGADVALTDPDALRAIVLGAVAVSISVVLGVGLGGVMKRTAAATTLLSVAMVGSQIFAIALPTGARPYLPGSALEATVTVTASDDLLGPVAGVLVLSLYAALSLAAALALVHRRDA